MTFYLKGHQSCSLSKFEGFHLLHRNRVFSNFQLWHPVTQMPFETQGGVLPFRKPPINISWDPDCYGSAGTLNVYQVLGHASKLYLT